MTRKTSNKTYSRHTFDGDDESEQKENKIEEIETVN